MQHFEIKIVLFLIFLCLATREAESGHLKYFVFECVGLCVKSQLEQFGEDKHSDRISAHTIKSLQLVNWHWSS